MPTMFRQLSITPAWAGSEGNVIRMQPPGAADFRQ